MKNANSLRYIRHFFCVAISILSIHTIHATELVYPKEAEDAGTMKLGEAILYLMPDEKSDYIGWDHRANGPIYWLTDGYETRNDNNYYREGLLQINVLGEFSTILLKRKHILAWSVTYYSDLAKPSRGVQRISLSPHECFGARFTGCEFELLPSLQKYDISVKNICESKRGAPYIAVYQISYPKKQTAYIKYLSDGGSGGLYSVVDMTLEQPHRSVCTEYDRF